MLQINNDTGAVTALNDTLNNVKFSGTAWSPDSKVWRLLADLLLSKQHHKVHYCLTCLIVQAEGSHHEVVTPPHCDLRTTYTKV